MTQDKEEAQENGDTAGFHNVFWVFAVGFILIFAGTIVIAAATSVGSSDASGSIVIFLGPFPIVFGAGPNAVSLIIIGAVLAITSTILFWVIRRNRDEVSV
jgi:uncharacterized membrane protein